MPQNYVQLTYPFPYKTTDGNISGSGSGNASYVNGVFSGNVTVAGTTTGGIITATTVMNSPYFVGNEGVNASGFSSQTNITAGTSAQAGWQLVNDVSDTFTMLLNSSAYVGSYAARTSVLESGATSTGLILNAKGATSANNTIDIRSNNVSGFQISNAAGIITTKMPQFTTGILSSNGSGTITSATTIDNVAIGSITPNTVAATTLTTNSSNTGYSAPGVAFTNTNVNPQCSFALLGPNVSVANNISWYIGQSLSTGNSMGHQLIYNNGSTTSYNLAWYGSSPFLSFYNSTTTSAVLTTPFTINTNTTSTTSGGFITNNANANPQASSFCLGASMTTGNQIYKVLGQATGAGLAAIWSYGFNSTAANCFTVLGFTGGGGGLLKIFNSTSTAATLSCPITVTGLITGTDYSGTVGATSASTGKFTTVQLTTNMATAGVLLNDASGNITSSLGALAVAKGGTGVTASYGTGTTVALPPTGGVAGQALLSGAGAGAAMTWSVGQSYALTRYQTTGTACPDTATTMIVWDAAGRTQGVNTVITYSAGTFTYTGSGGVVQVSASIFITNGGSVTGSMEVTIVPSATSAGYAASAVANTATLTAGILCCSGTFILSTNDTFAVYVKNISGASRTTGAGVTGSWVSAVALPI
jgi:hypothetical protein